MKYVLYTITHFDDGGMTVFFSDFAERDNAVACSGANLRGMPNATEVGVFEVPDHYKIKDLPTLRQSGHPLTYRRGRDGEHWATLRASFR